VENSKKAPPGIYQSLVSKEAQENDPSTKPWLDLTGYQIIELEVKEEPMEPPTAVSDASHIYADKDEVISFNASGSHDNDCNGQSIVKYEWDWEDDGLYDEEGVQVEHSWGNAGTYFVQLRVTDDEGDKDTLDTPIEVTVNDGSIPSNPVDVTPPWLNFSPYGICAVGGYAYIAGGANGLHIFDISDPSNPTWVNRVDTSCA